MKTKKCSFCRSTLDHHMAVLWDGFASACITRKKKPTKEARENYAERLGPVWKEWGRAFESQNGAVRINKQADSE